MVALTRQLLVLLLVLLQFAAPLVHAHIGESASVRGLHLHEFENLRLQKTGTFAEATLDHISSVQSAIVELGSAVKPQSSTNEVIANYYPPSDRLGLAAQPLLKVINFSPHEAGNLIEPSHNQHPSRAPPA
ncbi:hypothetical protein [Methylomonas methanica]|uniref:Uncharacterized protein n=1 Tax=Methylomonas methanica (strain DSM 25384 / MC09) TaxID=857087 RepID=F9ZYU5_METMM|nr:hypothetical protein [Methylomonas methanica]AEF98641.1 hypothetical protein Metme_0192 [Methylomonas methanica MC09]